MIKYIPLTPIGVVRAFIDDDDEYVLANDLFKTVGYKPSKKGFNYTQLTKGVEHKNKKYIQLSSEEKGLAPRVKHLFLNKDGVKQVLAPSRKPKAQILLQHMLDVVYTPPKQETNFGIMLHKTFKSVLDFKEQFKVGEYKIDFYFPSLNLAIEFDEVYHNLNKDKDKTREEYIKDILKCEFVRVVEGKELEAINQILKAYCKK